MYDAILIYVLLKISETDDAESIFADVDFCFVKKNISL